MKDQEQDDCGQILPLRDCVERTLKTYFKTLDGHGTCDLYRMVVSETEQALLKAVMDYAGGNQSRAAELLSINRGTLRKKLRQYSIDH